MDDYTRTETVTKTVSYGMPTGTPWAELCKLFNLARNELMGTKKPGADLYDNEIRVVAWDEEVRLVFKIDMEEGKDA